MDLLLTVHVHITGAEFMEGHKKDICMIAFDGTAESPWFNGKIIGAGVDTQKIEKDKQCFLSARYMLEGTDKDNQPCRIFIENNGSDMAHCKPTLYTNSAALADWETSDLSATVEPCEGGVTVRIYRN